MRRVGLLLLLLLACRKEAPAPAPAPPKPAPAAVEDGGRITVRLEGDVKTLNPLFQNSDDERQVLTFLHDPLVDLDIDSNPIPATAAKWDVLDGGRKFVLHLDPRATFSDGKPVRAADVVFTLTKIGDSPQFGGAFASLDLAETKAIDERTVQVVFKEARVAQLLSFNIPVLPEHVYGKGDFSRNREVVGNGPYVLQRREPGRSIHLRRRADYWRDKPHIENVVLRVVSDDATAWNALQRGDLDVARIDNATWQRVKDDPAVAAKLEFLNVYQQLYNAIAWNLADPKLGDVRVRRALAMAFDRRSVIEKLYFGHARPTTGPFTPDQWANDPNVAAIEFNPQGATALLSSAGWTDSDGDGVLDRNGEKFEVRLLIPSGNQPAADQSQIFQDALAKIGVKLEVAPLESTTFFDYILSRNYQAAFMAWVNDPDPDPFTMFHSSQVPPEGYNVVGYVNAEADRLMERARAEFDRQRRTDLYHDLHQILARDQPYLWTVQPGSKWAVNRRVHDVRPANSGAGLFIWYPGPRAWSVK
jgi:peptide/nickel transport system substrate-binding protein